MRKKCVLWAKPVLVTLAVVIAVSAQSLSGILSAQTSADPLTLPRLAFTDFTYQGAFRLPATPQGGDFSYGGSHMAFNAARNSLFVTSLHNKVAEVAIPAPANTTDVNLMPFATYLQPFNDPSEGRLQDIGNGTLLGGLLVHNNRLYATGYIYYDGMNTQVLSHFSRSTNLSDTSFSGLSQVWETGKAGFVGGYMANVPSEWQSSLGGPAITGQCCIPIVTRTSFGPAAFSLDPAGIVGGAAASASPLLYYTKEHATLGPWEGSTESYGAATMMGGVAVIAGTRTALFVGRIGAGKYCYGYGVTDPALDGTRAADGQTNCYDPTNAAKGVHGYPYRYQMWAYDLADFAAVKAGTKQPWDVVPYGIWPFDLPTPETNNVRIGGVAYDEHRQLLYVSQMFADKDGCCELRPLVHTLKINAPSSTAPPPLSTTVSLAPDRPAPQAPGALIRWSAVATGSKAPYEFKWVAYANGTWTMLRDWSASATFDWQPTSAAADARMAVWVRPAPASLPADDISADSDGATAEYPFPIADTAAAPTDTTSTSTPVASVALTTNVPAPQAAGSTIVWTATPTGGSGAQVYKWFISSDGISWNTIGSWTSSNQFTWTPSSSASYRVSAWVKRASNPNDEREASTELPYLITDAGSAGTGTSSSPLSSSTSTASTPVASLTLTTNVAAPQPAGSTVVWTATPTGGSGDQVYKWFVSSDGVSWTTIGTWSSSNQFAWTPSAVNANYRVSAWVKRASIAKDEWDAAAARPFAIAASTGGSTPVTPPAGTALPAVTVASTAVQTGAAIQFSVSGGPANRLDWVSISATGAPDTKHERWMYLNGSSTKPAAGTANAALQFIAPATRGIYNIRFFADNGYTKLATSATIVVSAPGDPILSVATTTVQAGAPIQFTVSDGPANHLDWVGIAPTAAGDTSYDRWMYLNGTTTKPAAGTADAALQFVAPSTPGSYNIRLFANNGFMKLATSVTITVTAPTTGPAVSVVAESVQPGAPIQFTVSGGPANRLDWVSLSATGAADTSHDRWLYLNGSVTKPAAGTSGATLQFIAPSTPGTYNIRFFADNGYKKLATSAMIFVGVASTSALPAVSVATTTVKPGAVIAFSVIGGPANRLDWVSISAETAADTGYFGWTYLNGTTIKPASGTGTAALQFVAPSTPGTYNIRFFADNGFTKLASSATVTVAP